MRTEQGEAVTGQVLDVPIFIADLVPGVTALSEVDLTEHPAGTLCVSGCTRDVSGCGIQHIEPAQERA